VYTAYWLRGCVNCKAKCYLQARQDAKLAISSIAALLAEKSSSAYRSVLEHDLADAYCLMGDAFKAEETHEDQDTRLGLVALYRARDLNPKKQEVWETIKTLEESLTLEDMREAARQVASQALSDSGVQGLRNPELLPEYSLDPEGSNDAAVSLSCAIGSTSMRLGDFNADMRAALRVALASIAGDLPAKQVVMDSVRAHGAGGFQANFILKFYSRDVAVKFVKNVEEGSSKQELIKALGEMNEDMAAALFESKDSCTVTSLISSVTKRDTLDAHMPLPVSESDKGALVKPVKPKLEMEVPYRTYSLVYSDGTPVPRKSKHAFALTIVRYDSKCNEKEIWTQLSDGSCRWRQSSSEVKLIALKVPADVKAGDFDVQIRPYYIRVSNKQSSEIYLEGTLERGIIPDESTWIAGQGSGEDGFMLFLQKMNLELLQKHWLHNEMWWPKLFTHHTDTEWDDCEKDYSDLPPTVMEQHRVKEAQQQIESQHEKAVKDELKCLDDLDAARIQDREAKLRMMQESEDRRGWVTPACKA